MSLMRVVWLPMAGFLFASSSGSVLAYDDPAEPLPCNSLCQRWMGMSADPGEPSVPRASADTASRPQAEPVAAAQPGPPISIAPVIASVSKANPERRVQVGIPKNTLKRRVAVSAPALTLVSPARAVVVARSQPAPIPLPPVVHPLIAPAAPAVALPSPEGAVPKETPFGSIASIDPVQRMVDLQPPPPPAPHLDVVALAASATPTSTPIITMLAPASADPAPPVVVAKTEPSVVAAPEPANVAQPQKVALQKQPAPFASASWPPPIDIIGAILMQPSVSRSANTTADASP